jgi:hypothetical protein
VNGPVRNQTAAEGARGARWRYRVTQALRRARADLHPAGIDDSAARAVLAGERWRLFGACGAADRQHMLCVLRALQSRGPVSPALADAALLHDAGKAGAGLNLAYRTLVVLLRAGGRLERWAVDDPRSWRYPLHLQALHAGRGAALCEAAGCDPHAVALVRWHETPPDAVPDAALRDDLRRLQEADEAC